MPLTLLTELFIIFCSSPNSSITPPPTTTHKSGRRREDETECSEGIQSANTSLAGLLVSRPPGTPLWLDHATLFNLYGNLLQTETQEDFDKLVKNKTKYLESLYSKGIPGMTIFGRDKEWMYMSPSSPTISLKEVKAFISRISTYFTNKNQQLRSMLLCPNGIDYQNIIAIFINDITNSTSRSNLNFKFLIERIMKDPTLYPRVKIARCIKLLYLLKILLL
jgi:hypothetical protein